MPGALLLVVFWDSSPEGAGGISTNLPERPNEVWQTTGMIYDGITSIATFGVPLETQLPVRVGGREARH
jgi:hypothetical protein